MSAMSTTLQKIKDLFLARNVQSALRPVTSAAQPGVEHGADIGMELKELSEAELVRVFTLLDRLSPENPMNERVDSILLLCNFVRAVNMPAELDDLWSVVQTFYESDDINARSAVLEFMLACLEGQYENTKGNRFSYFRILEQSSEAPGNSFSTPNNLLLILKILRNLTKDGRDLSSFERDIGSMLWRWLEGLIDQVEHEIELSPTATSTAFRISSELESEITSLLNFASNMIKFSFVDLEEDDVSRLAGSACFISRLTENRALTRESLGLLDGVVRYGGMPQSALAQAVEVLCMFYNSQEFSEISWQIMQNLLRSHSCRAASLALLRLLDHDDASKSEEDTDVHSETPNHPSKTRTLRRKISLRDEERLAATRAAIIFITAANWGTMEIERPFSMSAVLPYLLTASRVGNQTIATEILISVWKLLSSHKSELTVIDLEIIVGIMNNVSPHCIRLKDALFASGFRLGDGEFQPISGSSGSSNPEGPVGTPVILSLFNYLLISCKDMYISQATLSSSLFLSLLLEVGPLLSESLTVNLVDHAAMTSWFPSFSDWVRILEDVISVFFLQDTRESVRLKVLRVAVEAQEISQGIERDILFERVLIPVFRRIPSESNQSVLRTMVDFLVSVTRDCTPEQLTLLLGVLKSGCIPRPQAKKTALDLDSCTICAKTMTQLFQNCVLHFASQKSRLVFEFLVDVITDPSTSAMSRVSILLFLTSVRADPSARIQCPSYGKDWRPYSASPIESAETGPEFELVCHPLILSVAPPDYIEDPSPTAAPPAMAGTGPPLKFMILPIRTYVKALTDILAKSEKFEVVSVVWTKLPRQLENLSLFLGAKAEIEALRKTLLEMITSTDPKLQAGANIADLPSKWRKADVFGSYFKVLASVVIPHKHLCSKPQHDEAVLAFQEGVRNWRGATARFCMQILTLALLELPASMTKFLPSIIQLISTIQTTSLAVPTLEFLSALSHLPALFVNFREPDYRVVFMIAIQYIRASSFPNSATGNPKANALAQYTIQLAYHVVSLWFKQIKLNERKKYVPFIVHQLILDRGGSSSISGIIDESIEMVLDMLIQNAFADVSPRPDSADDITTVSSPRPPEKGVQSRTWAMGNALVTMEAWTREQKTKITIRRPSATISFWTTLMNKIKVSGGFSEPEWDATGSGSRQRFGTGTTDTTLGEGTGLLTSSGELPTDERSPLSTQSSVLPLSSTVQSEFGGENLTGSRVRSRSYGAQGGQMRFGMSQRETEWSLSLGSSASARRDDLTQVHMDPSFVLAQLSLYPDLALSRNSAIMLPEDEVTNRGLGVLDKITVVDLHKFGLVYVGRNQSKEVEILANRYGSPMYTGFLSHLGRFVKLKGCRHIYPGGLDTSEDIDGSLALYADQNDLSQIIFHCTTLMPNGDELNTAKKRHIGNDYVTIVWNESGGEYKFDTIPSQFAHVNIVIHPQPVKALPVVESGLSQSSTVSPVSSLPSVGLESPTSASTSPPNTLFRVEVQVRPDLLKSAEAAQGGSAGVASLPSLLQDSKVVFGLDSLAKLVRQVGVHANVASNILWHSQSSDWYVSSSLARLRQIKIIRDRAMGVPPGSAERERLFSGLSNAQLDVLLDFTKFL